MKKICLLICMILSMVLFTGCEEVSAQVETIAQQIDVEALVTNAIENINWSELKTYSQQGYDTLVEHFPALKSENIKAFLKANGLELLNSYVESSDTEMQDNAKKLGQIIKILNPELSDEVDSVIAE